MVAVGWWPAQGHVRRRRRLAQIRHTGSVLHFGRHFGWIAPDAAIDHPEARGPAPAVCAVALSCIPAALIRAGLGPAQEHTGGSAFEVAQEASGGAKWRAAPARWPRR